MFAALGEGGQVRMPLTKTFFSPRFGMLADRFGVGLDGHRRAQGRGLAMRFMVMLKADKNTEAGVPPSTELLAAMGKYNEELVKAGVLLAGEGLQPSAKGARIKFSGGKRTVTDGPFPGGGADRRVLDVPGQLEGRGDRMGQALPRSPSRRRAEIEIRQVFEASDFETMTPELREQEEKLRATIESRRR